MSQVAADPDLWEQLVDVEDPVLPDVIEPLRKMNEEEARESDAQLSVVATVLAVLSLPDDHSISRPRQHMRRDQFRQREAIRRPPYRCPSAAFFFADYRK